MLEVYRVEHKTTRMGPFQTPSPFTQRLAELANNCGQLKSPGTDGLPLGNIPFFFVFGSPGLPALRRWLLLGDTPEENAQIVATLDELGFVLAEYLVEEDSYLMGLSKLQVAFDADACREESLVNYHPLQQMLSESLGAVI